MCWLFHRCKKKLTIKSKLSKLTLLQNGFYEINCLTNLPRQKSGRVGGTGSIVGFKVLSPQILGSFEHRIISENCLPDKFIFELQLFKWVCIESIEVNYARFIMARKL